MIEVSNEWKENIYEQHTALRVRATLNLTSGITKYLDFEEGDGDFISLTLSDATSSENSFDVGNFVLNTIEFVLNNSDRRWKNITLVGAEFLPEIGFRHTRTNYAIGAGNYTTGGSTAGWSATPSTFSNYYTITAYDGYVRIYCKTATLNSYIAFLNLSDDFDSDREHYTATIRFRASEERSIRIYLECTSESDTESTILIDTITASSITAGSWVDYSITFEPDENYTYTGIGLSLDNYNTSGYYIDVEYIMVESGVSFSEYKRALEDWTENGVEWIKKGTYHIIENGKRSSSRISLTAYDNTNAFETPFSGVSVTYPITLGNLAQTICDYVGITLATPNFPNYNKTVNEIQTSDSTSYTCRQIISYLAMYAGCFARCNVDGELEIRWYGDSEEYNNITEYSTLESNESDTTITGVKVIAMENTEVASSDDDSEETTTTDEYLYGSEDDYLITIENNPLIPYGNAETVANIVGPQIVGTTFRAVDLKALYDPSIEAGDTAVTTDENDEEITFYVANINVSVGSYAEIRCGSEESNGVSSESVISYIMGSTADLINIKFDNFVAKNLSAEIANLGYLSAEEAEITYAKIETLEAITGRFDTLEADVATIEKAYITTADIETLLADYATIKYLDANFATIENLNATNGYIETLQSDVATIKEAYITTADIETLLADYATIKYLDANFATIENLNATNGYIETLQSDVATIKEAYITEADIETLRADVAIIGSAYISEADISDLRADVASITTLLAGSESVSTLEAIHLTTDNAVIDSAVIEQAYIDNAAVSSLLAGNIYTNFVTIQPAEGDKSLYITESIIAMYDDNDVQRLQAGMSSEDEGYNFVIWDADGTELFNATGITATGIPSETIVNDHVSETAAIKGTKLDIDSVVRSIEDDGTLRVDYANVLIDNTTLAAEYTTIKTAVDIVDVLQTEFSVDSEEGKITNRVWETYTDEAIGELSDQYATLVISIEGIESSVGRMISTFVEQEVEYRNYALLSGNYTEGGSTGWVGLQNYFDSYYTITTYDGYTRAECIASTSSSYRVFLPLSDDFDNTVTHTISVRIRPSSAVAIGYGHRYFNSGSTSASYGGWTKAASNFTAGEWTEFTQTWTPDTTQEYTHFYIMVSNLNTIGDYLDIEYVMYEQGSTAHDWEPAPEDGDPIKYVTSVINQFSAITETIDSISLDVTNAMATAQSAYDLASSIEMDTESITATVKATLGLSYRNYLLQSGGFVDDSDISEWYSSSTNFDTNYAVSVADEGYVRIECVTTNTNPTHIYIPLSDAFEGGKTYNIIAKVRPSKATGYAFSRVYKNASTGSGGGSGTISGASSVTKLTAGEWNIVSTTWSTSDTYLYTYCGIYLATSNYFAIHDEGDYLDIAYMIVQESDSEELEWLPAPEDLGFDTTVLDQYTTIEMLSDSLTLAVFKDSLGYIRLGASEDTDGGVYFTAQAENFSIGENGYAVFGYADGNHIDITTTSIDVCDDTTVLASFGETVTIGEKYSARIVQDSSSFSIIDKDDTEFFFAGDKRIYYGTETINEYVINPITGSERYSISLADYGFIPDEITSVQADGSDISYKWDGKTTLTFTEDTASYTITVTYSTFTAVHCFTFGSRLDDSDIGANSTAIGRSITASASYAVAEGFKTVASAPYAHAEGDETTASGTCAHSEGYSTTASGAYAHSEGYGTTASGTYAHAEGRNTTASGLQGHAEGYNTTAGGAASHTEGSGTSTSATGAHAEGYGTTASGTYAHAEGRNTTASGGYGSHAEGNVTTASALYSHAEGMYTLASSACQHVFGKYNVEDTDSTYIEIVGNGTGTSARANARTLDWDGNEVLAGNLTCANIGTTYSNSATVTCSSGGVDTYVTGGSITLPAGTFVVVARGTFTSNTTEAQRRVSLYNSTSGASIATTVLWTNGWASGEATNIITLTDETKLTCRLSTGIGSSLSNCTALIQAVRIN